MMDLQAAVQSQINAARLAIAVRAGPMVLSRSRITPPITASTAWTVTIATATAAKNGVEPTKIAATATTARAELRAHAYIEGARPAGSDEVRPAIE